jgi:hypothetical protein
MLLLTEVHCKVLSSIIMTSKQAILHILLATQCTLLNNVTGWHAAADCNTVDTAMATMTSVQSPDVTFNVGHCRAYRRELVTSFDDAAFCYNSIHQWRLYIGFTV